MWYKDRTSSSCGACRTWSNFSRDAAHMSQGLAIRTIYMCVLGRIKTGASVSLLVTRKYASH